MGKVFEIVGAIEPDRHLVGKITNAEELEANLQTLYINRYNANRQPFKHTNLDSQDRRYEHQSNYYPRNRERSNSPYPRNRDRGDYSRRHRSPSIGQNNDERRGYRRNSMSKSPQRNDDGCYNCGAKTHWARDCDICLICSSDTHATRFCDKRKGQKYRDDKDFSRRETVKFADNEETDAFSEY